MSALGINTCKKGGKQDWTEVGLLSSHSAIAHSESNSEKRSIPLLQGNANSDSMLELFLWLAFCCLCYVVIVVRSLSVLDSLWPHGRSTPGSPVFHCLPEFAQIHVHWVRMLSKHLILCHPVLLLSSVFPSIRVFSNESAVWIRCPKYWSFSLSISPSNEYSGLFSFRMDWFDLLAVHSPLKSRLQHHNLKASLLQCLAFFMVQLSHLYVTAEKTIALTIGTFVNKMVSLLFNMLSVFVRASFIKHLFLFVYF